MSNAYSSTRGTLSRGIVGSLLVCWSLAHAEMSPPDPLHTALLQLTHARVAVRKEALRTLARLGDDSAVPVLVKELLDKDPEARRLAAQALWALHDPRNLAPILIEALRDKDLRVRQGAAQAFRTLYEPQALLKAMKHWDPGVRQGATYALSVLHFHVHHSQAAPALVNVLEDQDPEMRGLAARALGIFGDPQAVPPLEKALRDSAPNVRAAARQSLEELGMMGPGIFKKRSAP